MGKSAPEGEGGRRELSLAIISDFTITGKSKYVYKSYQVWFIVIMHK